MSTLAQIRSRALAWVSRSSVPNFDGIIELAEADINRELRIPAMHKVAVVGFDGHRGRLPADFLELVSVDVASESRSAAELRNVSIDIFKQQPEYRYSGGYPCIYAVSGGYLYLAPAPGTSVDITYYGKVAPLVNDDDTNVATEQAYDIYFNGVLKNLYAYLRNTEEEGKYTGKFMAGLSKANTQATLTELGTGVSQTSGYTRPIV